ncbi:hypothetical protein [Zavarzinia sp.]|uniref:hypothetical protein n=1 Tax=Zavarzinia sp. TaxID=2027920 RepID=UPI00356A81D4
MSPSDSSPLFPIDRRTALLLGLGALAALPARAATAPAKPAKLRLLAPALYGDGALLKALGGDKAQLELAPLASGDEILAPLRPLPPTATAQQQAVRPALVVAGHEWARGILWPEGVIEPLGKDGAVPQTAIVPAPEMAATPGVLELGIEGRYLLGRAIHLDIAALGFDRRRVSRDAVEDQGLALLDDAALTGRYGLVADPARLLPMAMLYAGLDPFRLQMPSEIRRFEAAAQDLVERAGLVAPPAGLAAALAKGTIDFALPLGPGDLAGPRLAGAGDLVTTAPNRGPIAGFSAFYSVELLCLASQSTPLPAARAVIERAGQRPVVEALVRAGGGLRLAIGLFDPAFADLLTPEERAALALDELPALLRHAAPARLVPERGRLQPLLAKALAGRG